MVRVGNFQRDRRHAFSGEHSTELVASNSAAESSDLRAGWHAHGATWQRSIFRFALSAGSVAGFRGGAGTLLRAGFFLGLAAHQDERYIDAQLIKRWPANSKRNHPPKNRSRISEPTRNNPQITEFTTSFS